MSKAALTLIATGISLGAVAQGTAQTAPAGQQAAPQAQGSTSPRQQGVLSTQYLMQNNGGSLLQASQPTPGSETAADANKPPSYDFYGVKPLEPHVLKKHDLVNIVVNETSKSQTSGTSDQERAADLDAKVDAFVKFNIAKLSVLGGAEGANPPEMKLEGTRDFKGTGEYDRSDTMTTRLEAEVLDVKPDGRLVIQAHRHLKIDEEEIDVTLTGECRVADVDAANSVLSTDLHDLDLRKITKGEVTDTNKRSILHRLLDILAPF